MYTLWIVTSDNVDIYLCALQMLSCVVNCAGIKKLTHPVRKIVQKSSKNHEKHVCENNNGNKQVYNKYLHFNCRNTDVNSFTDFQNYFFHFDTLTLGG